MPRTKLAASGNRICSGSASGSLPQIDSSESASAPWPQDHAKDRCRSRVKKNERGTSMRTIIKLVSNSGSGHFYTTTKNMKLSSTKLQLRKYDPVAMKHVFY